MTRPLGAKAAPSLAEQAVKLHPTDPCLLASCQDGILYVPLEAAEAAVEQAREEGRREEREACLKACEAEKLEDETNDPSDEGYMWGIADCMVAIRARSERSSERSERANEVSSEEKG
jgi:hypothetical protein